MTLTTLVCAECDAETESETAFCPDCGAEAPWEEQPVYEFDTDDLPVAFSCEFYNDNWKLWDEFCESYFGGSGLTGEDVAGIPDEFPRLETCCVDVWFVVTDSFTVEGPYLERPSV